MKFLVALSAVLAVSSASGIALPLFRSGIIAPAAIQNQFHAQDALGQYSYGYSDGLSTKQEVKSFDGVTRGSYSYVDAKGELQTVDYAADALNGFRVAGTNLPKAIPNPAPILPAPVVDTPEVLRAREAHLAALEDAKIRASQPVAEIKTIPRTEDLPKPVEDTPEVALAKAEHLAAKKDAELRNSLISEVRVAPALSPISAFPAVRTLGYASPIHTAAFAPGVLPALRTIIPGTEIPSGFAYSVRSPLWNSRFLSSPLIY